MLIILTILFSLQRKQAFLYTFCFQIMLALFSQLFRRTHLHLQALLKTLLLILKFQVKISTYPISNFFQMNGHKQ